MSENLRALLDVLADESRSLQTINLTELSDLARGEVAIFRARWDALAPVRRLALLSAMVEQAEANIHLNFHAILRSCLNDSDPRIRKLAVEGLWEDDKVNLVRPLIDLLNHDQAEEVRSVAALSLGRYVLLGVLGEIADAPAREAEAALFAAWGRYAEPVAVRRRALESLACSGLSAVPDMIRSAYDDESELMRQSAIYAMGRSADSRWARFVLAELHNQRPAMRFESALAAGELGLRQAVQPLIGRLDDPDSTVREAAVVALGKIGGPAARRALRALLGGHDEALAQAAEDALDELAFGSQQLETTLVDDAAVRSRHGHSGGDEADGAWQRDDLEDDELGDEWEDEADSDDEDADELTDLYEDELFGNDAGFGSEDDDDIIDLDEEDWGEEDWDNMSDDLA